VDTYRISVGIDIVNDPSAPDANVEVIGFGGNTNLQESLTINNSVMKNERSLNLTTLINGLKTYGKS